MRKSTMAEDRTMPVERFFGIGAKRAEAFHRIGIFTANDLVYHFPRAYEPRGSVKTTLTAKDGEVCSLILTVNTEPKTAMIRRGMVITKLAAFDDDGKCAITFFNQPYVKDVMHKGATFRFFGKVKREGFSVSMSAPAYEPYDGVRPLRPLVPVYPLTEGISQKLMGATVREALRILNAPAGITDPVPPEVRGRYGLCTLGEALSGIHAPQTPQESESSRKRLAFDELYCFAISMLRYGRERGRPAEFCYEKPDREAFLAKLPYQLTGAQLRTIGEIESDMTGAYLMNRLVVGDVGSGKTVCAAYAAYTALSAGCQVALMAPTEILARQHYEELSRFFEAFGFRTVLLVGGMTAAAKRRTADALAVGAVDFVIGTHALIEDSVAFRRLGLVIIDEQHRFGAGQRRALADKSRGAHLLTMSATPIPRTLAMVLYCDTDVSLVDEMPPGRQKVDTFCVDERYRERLYAFIRKNIEAGGQVYIVCPAVEDEEKIESESGEVLLAKDLVPLGASLEEEKPRLKAAVGYAKFLSEEVFPEYRVAFLHGKLSGAAKDKIMNSFAAGKVDILVSTTVIEVGVNVPRATLMIVENAEFFGLSALHQLRGRVGRGEKKSYCVLVTDSKAEKVKERMKILCESSDGFRIAEKDLEMRGPGDFLEQSSGKIRQSGEFDLGLASLEGDAKLLYAAFDEAKRLLAQDPALEELEHRPLAAYIQDKIENN